MHRRTALALLTALVTAIALPVEAVTTTVALTTTDLRCDDCGRPWSRGQIYAGYVRPDGTWGSLCDGSLDDPAQRGCYERHRDEERAARRCARCGIGTQKHDGAWALTSAGWTCLPCHEAKTRAAARCADCNTAAVVVFDDGAPRCAAHRRWLTPSLA